jgi:hypothetical protein
MAPMTPDMYTNKFGVREILPFLRSKNVKVEFKERVKAELIAKAMTLSLDEAEVDTWLATYKARAAASKAKIQPAPHPTGELTEVANEDTPLSEDLKRAIIAKREAWVEAFRDSEERNADRLEDELGDLEYEAMATNTLEFDAWKYADDGYGHKYPMEYRRAF